MKLLVLLSLLVVLVACSVGQECNGGCLCNSVDSCPTGCYVSQSGTGAPFCSNDIVSCGGGSWSTGTPRNNCGVGTAVDTDAGPAGGFCCSTIVDAGTD